MLNPCHPGETLRDDLAVAGLTMTEAAARLGWMRLQAAYELAQERPSAGCVRRHGSAGTPRPFPGLPRGSW